MMIYQINNRVKFHLQYSEYSNIAEILAEVTRCCILHVYMYSFVS